jgi:hypothetical protein
MCICWGGGCGGRSMEGSGGGGSSPAKEPSLSFWRRKTNVFVAMPTLLSL